MKCLIVDDSVSRTNLIKESLSKIPNGHLLEFIYCETADSARKELKQPIDLMLLDVLIPKKRNGVPEAQHSFNLLSEICNPGNSYIRPRLIIGLTADIEELGIYQEEFAREMAVVLRGSLTELGWLESLHTQIQNMLGVEKKINQNEKDRLLISVHGIRTYGQWQAKISEEVSKSSRSFESVEIKYGRFDLFCFSIPFLRNRVIEREAKNIINNISKFKGREIHVIGHSFGTLIIAEAFKILGKNHPIKTVILCGSPMRHNDSIDHIVEASDLTINECGIHDLVLVAARLFLLGLGDAGRVGFSRENSTKFQNRYYLGGHSLYFDSFGGELSFYERNWIPRIALGNDMKRFDFRRPYFGEDLVDLLIKFLTHLKPIFYLSPALYLVYAISIYISRIQILAFSAAT